MTVFKRTHPEIGKRQTKLYLSGDAFARLQAVSKASGLSMSVIVEVLIKDHCRMEADRPQRERTEA